ncbi:MAG: YraN family protein [Eggerthellaceae bacterium]|nr:YraN family protein [Eggerthellaceae bacterium]
MHNKEIGSWGEDIAVDFLKKRGFSLLERTGNCFAGEAVIIALDDKALHFVEVKTRIGTGKGFPAEAVNAKKRQRYEAISELYLSSYDGCETGITFDIISVTLLPNDRVFVRCYNNVLSSDCR